MLFSILIDWIEKNYEELQSGTSISGLIIEIFRTDALDRNARYHEYKNTFLSSQHSDKNSHGKQQAHPTRKVFPLTTF